MMGSRPEVYSNDMAATSGANVHNVDDPIERRYGEIADKFLFFLDPPEHTTVRSVFRHAFTPQAIKAWRPTVERIADDLIADYESGDEVDFMGDLAAKIPIGVIATIREFVEESVEQDGAFSFEESEEGGAERFVVVDAVECGVEVAESVCDGPSVADCCRVEGDCVVGVTGGRGLPDLGGLAADFVSELEGGGFASEMLSEGSVRLLGAR